MAEETSRRHGAAFASMLQLRLWSGNAGQRVTGWIYAANLPSDRRRETREPREIDQLSLEPGAVGSKGEWAGLDGFLFPVCAGEAWRYRVHVAEIGGVGSAVVSTWPLRRGALALHGEIEFAAARSALMNAFLAAL